MAKIYEFPTVKELPDELKNRLRHIAEDYLHVLEDATEYFYGDECTEDQIDEVGALVTVSYVEVISDLIKELEES